MRRRRFSALSRAGILLGGSIILALGALPQAGCRGIPAASAPKPSAEALYPSLQLDGDLVKSFVPSNDRDWVPEQAVLARADIDGNRLTVHDIRNCRWRAPTM